VQCRRDDAGVLAALAALDDAASRAAVTAERRALALAEGGCDVAFGAYCFAQGGKRTLVAMLERGGAVHTARADGDDPAALAAAVWSKLGAAAAP
jgi:hydroxymethylbilane synthase